MIIMERKRREDVIDVDDGFEKRRERFVYSSNE
jgi:hypothetical protein